MQWVMVVVRLPVGPSRHRVAIWRELRRLGAVSLSAGTWAAPATVAVLPTIGRVQELAGRADGEILVLDARPHDEATETGLQAAFNEAREAEWAEFLSECDKFVAEIAKEQRIGKLTLAELDEEEHSLERLRRWWRDLKARDAFGLPTATEAETRLKACSEVLEDYAERVYQAIHAPATRPGGADDA
jgi:hypothetical protein